MLYIGGPAAGGLAVAVRLGRIGSVERIRAAARSNCYVACYIYHNFFYILHYKGVI